MTVQDKEKLPDGQLNRLWQHRQDVVFIFNNFVNYFLVSESILLAVVGMLVGKPFASKILLLSIVTLGLVLNFVWIYIQGKQLFIINVLKDKCKQQMPEYKDTLNIWQASKWKISNGWLLAYFIPSVMVVVWVVVFAAIVVS